MKRPDDKQRRLLRELLKKIGDTLNDETREIGSVELTHSLDTAPLLTGGTMVEKPTGYSKLMLKVEYTSKRILLRDPVKFAYQPRRAKKSRKKRMLRRTP